MTAPSPDPAAVAPTEVVDPVCGMTIDPADAAGQHDYRGHTYYFCNQRWTLAQQTAQAQRLKPKA